MSGGVLLSFKSAFPKTLPLQLKVQNCAILVIAYGRILYHFGPIIFGRSVILTKNIAIYGAIYSINCAIDQKWYYFHTIDIVAIALCCFIMFTR